jgi:hypothetical protein
MRYEQKLNKLGSKWLAYGPFRRDEVGHAHEWLEAIALGTMETFTRRILEIPKLSTQGSKQLAKDIGMRGARMQPT